MSPAKLIFRFEELGQEHKQLVGKKCANLGEMRRMGLPVPLGFATSIDMYRRFAKETGAAVEIAEYVKRMGKLKGKSIAVFDEMSLKIRGIIEGKEMPVALVETTTAYYRELEQKGEKPDGAVSVRSSGTESRPGMFETYLNVVGIEDVLDKIKKVWSSAYTARAIALRVNKDIPVNSDELGVAVIKMVNARSAGIAFTLDPVTGDTSKIIINSGWGLGEGVVNGTGDVDRFVVDKATLEIVESAIGKKTKRVVSEKQGVGHDDVPAKKRSASSLSQKEIAAIAKIALHLEEHFDRPQDTEWAIDSDSPTPHHLLLLQTRPAKLTVRKPESVTDRMIDLIVQKFYRP
ncbi:MAG: PEP/pyruvate-binding domain-containing protein [Dehalococcoidia bacterium]|jgi:pyruvate,water dikinase